MTIDTLAYTKPLEAAGVDRRAAEAQAEALIKHILPGLVTKADLEQAIGRLEHRLTVRFFGMMLGIVGVMDGVLFALLRFVPLIGAGGRQSPYPIIAILPPQTANADVGRPYRRGHINPVVRGRKPWPMTAPFQQGPWLTGPGSRRPS
jgi:hypothetical protein